ncbi:MAG TPA: Lsr2 family protein [Streptosporangiaceae bacterium]|nr:Lsr2 family protein [Streptosporangiaceae bacterium]
MASIVSVIVKDDLDGSEGAETVTFTFDGVTYEIDLSEKNRTKLQKAVAPYIEAGRRISRSRSRTSASRHSGARVDRAVVRVWAKENGLKVSERGRISADVMAQYEAAH